MGIPIEGTINDFTDAMRPRFPLQKRVGDERYYIFKGTVYGHILYLKAEYTRKSRTVYRVTVEPKHIDQNALIDSLVVDYGTPEEITGGYRWTMNEGDVLLYTPEGYDPVLMYFDREGLLKYKEEK